MENTEKDTKAAPVKETKNKQEVDELRAKISQEMAEKAKNNQAVWQIDKANRPTMHLPLNPVSGNYFQNGTAIQMMQAQMELGTADNRWISMKALHVMQQEHKNIAPQKGAKSMAIVSGEKVSRMFNYSQLKGKDLPLTIEKTDNPKDAYAEHMLAHNTFDKVDLATEFFATAKKAYASAEINAKEQAQKRADYEEAVAPYLGEFEKRLTSLKEVDISKKAPTTAQKKFVYDMAKAYQKEPTKSSYVFTAAREAMLAGVPKNKVKEFITKYAPESAKDPAKTSKYSDFVIKSLDQDKEFQKEVKKSNTAAR